MSIEFETRPVRRSRGPDAGVLLMIGIAAFVGLALFKPWEEAAPTTPSAPDPSPTASPERAAAAPTPTPAAERTVVLPPVLRETPSRLLAALPPRVALGLRVIVPAGEEGSPESGDGLTPLLNGAVFEWWTRASTTGSDSGSDLAMPIRIAAAAVGSPALAIGVTTGAADAALDVRFWRVTDGGLQRLTTPDLVSGSIGAERLFLAPREDGPIGAWPAGAYLAEILLGTRVVAIPFELPGGTTVPPTGPPAAAGFTPDVESVGALLGRRWGAFALEAGGHATSVAALAGRQLDPRRAWLATAEPDGVDGPRIARIAAVDAVVLGVTLPRDAVLQAASLWSLAPEARPLDAVRLVGAGADPTARFVAFARPDGGIWPPGMYRITARYWDAAYRLREWSWHLDITSDITSDDGNGASAPAAATGPSALLAVAGRWAALPRRWSVLSTAMAPTARAIEGAVDWPREPQLTASTPESLLAMCPGSARADRASRVIGLRIPEGAAVSALRLIRRFEGNRSLVIATERVVIPSLGLALFVRVGPGGSLWDEGYYDIEVVTISDSAADHAPPPGPRYFPLCIGIGAAAPSAFRIHPDAGTAAAYAAALVHRLPDRVTMLAP